MAGRAVIAMRARVVHLSIAAALACSTTPCEVAAQQIEPCDAPWLDVDHVQAILQVELGDAWDASIDATVVRFEECASDQPRIVLAPPGAEPTTLTLRLQRFGPRARTRLVALVLAELLRTRASEEDEPAPIEEVAPELATPRPTVAAAPLPAAEVPAAEMPAAEMPGATLAPAAAPSEARALAAPTSSPEPPVTSSPWRLGATLGARVYSEQLTLAALAEISLRYDRLLIAVGGAGTQLETFGGTVRLGQLTIGGGARLLEHRGRVRVGWDVRADAGAAMALGEASPDVFGLAFSVATYTWTLSASTQLEVVWPIGPIELGVTTDVGYQRGIVEQNAFGGIALAGVYASLGLSLGVTP